MKVALIQCPGWGRDCPPYTMALLSAWLRQEGHEAFGFDFNNTLYCSGPDKYRKMWDDKDQYSFWHNEVLISEFTRDNSAMLDFQISKVLETEAKIIGFTVHFSSLLMSLEVAKRIKEKSPDKIIVFGGPDCCRQLRGNDFIKKDFVDIVVVGEGDLVLLNLVKMIEEDKKPYFCPGALVKDNGSIIDCGDGPILDDLDLTPFPDYSDFSQEIALGHYRQPERLDILDSRGCITCCHFCSEWQFWKKFRSMSGERMFEEITYQMKKHPGVNYFYFIGSLLNGDVPAISRFSDLVIQNDLKIRWAGQAVVRPEMTKELLEKMRKAGCEWLGIGIESGSSKVMINMHKRFSIENAQNMLEFSHKAGISTQTNFMFGVPTETEDDFRQSLEFLKRNRENIDSVLASQSFCVIDKGTYLYAHAQEFGIINQDHHLYWEAKDNDYPQRFRRYEEFCQLALSLGLPETSGVLRVKPDKWLLLGDYYLFKKDYAQAADCFEKSIEFESRNKSILEKIKYCEVSNFNFDEKQKKIINNLQQKGLDLKAENFMLIEKQKQSREELVDGYPYWLTIDPSNLCNLRCRFCPTGQQRNSRTKGMLQYDNFKALMDQLGQFLIHIDFCNWGEPLLNKDLPRMIKYAKEFCIDTKVDTSLNNFNEEDAEAIISSGLDKIIVSIDGASEETYSKYRVGGNFGTVMNNLKMLLLKKKQLGRHNPHVCWQFLVFRHNEHEIDEVRKMGAELGVDSVGITRAFIGDKDWIPTDKAYSNYKEDSGGSGKTSDYFNPIEKAQCNWLWEAIAVNPNGSVSPCCSVEDEKDDFGNVFEQPFQAIWNNEKYRAARRCVANSEKIGENDNICIGCKHSGIINLDLLI